MALRRARARETPEAAFTEASSAIAFDGVGDAEAGERDRTAARRRGDGQPDDLVDEGGKSLIVAVRGNNQRQDDALFRHRDAPPTGETGKIEASPRADGGSA